MVLGHPFETIKVRVQMASQQTDFLVSKINARGLKIKAGSLRNQRITATGCAGELLRAEGVRSLWKGMSQVMMVSMPATALTFVTMD